MAKQSKHKEAVVSGDSMQVVNPGAVTPGRLPWFRRDWFWGLILLLAVILTYTPMWRAGFIWDDDVLVTANPCIVGPLGLKEIWTTSAARFYPLVLTTFWLEHALWGSAPLPYHLVNILLHAIGTVVLWRVLRNLEVPGAWLGAALWALHPVQVETVAWISELKNTESCLFYLLTILFFVKELKAGSGGNRSGGHWNYALSLLCAALAMASKSSTLLLPVVLGLCTWWVKRRWGWRDLARVGLFLLMSLVASIITMQTVRGNRIDELQGAQSWLERMLTAGDVFWFYLGKLLWPHPLIAFYPSWKIDAGQWISYLPIATLVLTSSILWFKRQSWSRPYFFAFVYYLVNLLPVMGLFGMINFRYSLVEDHLQYLASMGPLALAGAGLARFFNFAFPGRGWLQAIPCATLLLILGGLSWQRAWVYESQKTLWTDTLARNPNCWVGYNNLGVALVQEGRVDAAMAQNQKVLAINPNNVEARNNLGLALMNKGQVDAAMAQYQKALEIEPRDAKAHNNLGVALLQEGKMDEAVAQYQKALEIDPNFAPAYNNLGNVFLQKGQLDEAMVECEKALEIDPNDAEIHNNLGNILLQKGREDEASAQYQKTLAINPNKAETRFSLGLILLDKGQLDEAIAQFREGIRLKPDDNKAFNNLGIALFQKGQVDEAMTQFQKALQLKPDYGNAQDNLAKAKAILQQRAVHP